MNGTAVAIRDLTVRLSGRTVLEGVSASLPEGGCTVFVGPNGAGKTTLLLCLLGEVPYAGSIRLSARCAGRIGYVPQNLNYDVQTPVTVEEFLSLGISRRPLWFGFGKKALARTREALEQVGLPDCAKLRLGDLSGGQMRRVLLASALLRNPALLMLDEPAAGVDLKGERLFWEMLDNARRRCGLTIAMVSHNLPLAAHYATHVVCVHEGSVVEGPPRAVLTARNLIKIFGVPIHLYPDQCSEPHLQCPKCGAFGMEEEGLVQSACACPMGHEGVLPAGPACLLPLAGEPASDKSDQSDQGAAATQDQDGAAAAGQTCACRHGGGHA